MIASLRAWWLGLARRERAMTAAAGSFVLLALLYLIAIEPATVPRYPRNRYVSRLIIERVRTKPHSSYLRHRHSHHTPIGIAAIHHQIRLPRLPRPVLDVRRDGHPGAL